MYVDDARQDLEVALELAKQPQENEEWLLKLVASITGNASLKSSVEYSCFRMDA